MKKVGPHGYENQLLKKGERTVRKALGLLIVLAGVMVIAWGCTHDSNDGPGNAASKVAAPVSSGGHMGGGGGGGGMGGCNPDSCICPNHEDCGGMMGGGNCDPDCPSCQNHCGGGGGGMGGGGCDPDSCICNDCGSGQCDPDCPACEGQCGGGMGGGGCHPDSGCAHQGGKHHMEHGGHGHR